jgi:hypothetical protein
LGDNQSFIIIYDTDDEDAKEFRAFARKYGFKKYRDALKFLLHLSDFIGLMSSVSERVEVLDKRVTNLEESPLEEKNDGIKTFGGVLKNGKIQ